MVSYAHMSDKELKDYRKRMREYDKKQQKEWERQHPNGVDKSQRTPFDNQHAVPYLNR